MCERDSKCVCIFMRKRQKLKEYRLLVYKGACVCARVRACVVFVASAVVELVINVCIIFLGATIFKKYGAAQSPKV